MPGGPSPWPGPQGACWPPLGKTYPLLLYLHSLRVETISVRLHIKPGTHYVSSYTTSVYLVLSPESFLCAKIYRGYRVAPTEVISLVWISGLQMGCTSHVGGRTRAWSPSP